MVSEPVLYSTTDAIRFFPDGGSRTQDRMKGGVKINKGNGQKVVKDEHWHRASQELAGWQ